MNVFAQEFGTTVWDEDSHVSYCTQPPTLASYWVYPFSAVCFVVTLVEGMHTIRDFLKSRASAPKTTLQNQTFELVVLMMISFFMTVATGVLVCSKTVLHDDWPDFLYYTDQAMLYLLPIDLWLSLLLSALVLYKFRQHRRETRSLRHRKVWLDRHSALIARSPDKIILNTSSGEDRDGDDGDGETDEGSGCFGHQDPMIVVTSFGEHFEFGNLGEEVYEDGDGLGDGNGSKSDVNTTC